MCSCSQHSIDAQSAIFVYTFNKNKQLIFEIRYVQMPLLSHDENKIPQ